MEWFFSGLGTMLISLIIGFITGGVAGYNVGIHKQHIRQNQKAGNNAVQTQIGEGDYHAK